ncbi:MAG TPA: cbb3-type cytochrome c oxidase subunit I [Polyangia bacterium]|nr:cbb3-type cytochrome c oxidase subunit I [Polyangia bacterium]
MGLIFSRDHKVIARQFLWLGLAFLAVGGAMAIVIRWSLAYPGRAIAGYVVTPSSYTTLFTMHGTIMIFFAVTPILIGAFGNFLIPLQLGARDMSFPTLNMVSFWTQLVASIVAVAAWLVPASANAGWTGYPPLSTPVGTPGIGQTLWTLALILAGASTTMGAVNYITTVLRERAPGMTLMRMPLTIWGLWLTSILNALFVPVLGAAMLLLLSDRLFGTHFFVAGVMVRAGGDPLLYQHLFWIFGHPEVYILILPVWGIVGDLISFFARKPAYGYRMSVISMATVTVLSSLVYGHHLFVAAMTPMLGRAFMVLTLLISAPAMILFLNWMHTLWRGSIRLEVPMLFTLGVLFVFGVGGLTGLFLADIPQDVYLHDTFFVVGHFHLIMAAAVFLGSFAAIYFWFPKMFGRSMSRTLGTIHFAITLPCLVVIFGGMLLLGNAGMQRRLYDPSAYELFRPLRPWNVALTHTAFLLAAAQLLFVWNFFASLLRGKPATDNPWSVGTLEWTHTTTPPGPHNFAEIPTVRHGPHEFNHPQLDGDGDKDWLGQAEKLPGDPE